jgi:two-component sensor histidine kinase
MPHECSHTYELINRSGPPRSGSCVDPNRIALLIDAGRALLPIGAAVSLGQIANELPTNAL